MVRLDRVNSLITLEATDRALQESHNVKDWPTPRLDTHAQATLAQISDIQVECHKWDIPEARYRNTGGYIKFIGTYSYGSSGRDDAMFIEWRLNEFLEVAPELDGLIVDLRELHYTWGNNLNISAYQIDDAYICIVIPSQEENKEVYRGYTGILKEKLLRIDLSTAFREVAQAVLNRQE